MTATFNYCEYSDDGTMEGGYPDVVIFGAPFDQLATGHTNQREAPFHIRNAGWWPPDEMVRLGVKDSHGREWRATQRMVDLGDAENVIGKPADSHANIFELAYIAANSAKRLSVMMGGDDSVNLPALRAVAKVFSPPQLVVLDAHLDCWEGHDHGTWVREAIEQKLVSSVDVYGVRCLGPNWGEGWQYKLTLHGETVPTTMASLPQLHSNAPVYLALDIDVIDPAYAPGTGTPEPFGAMPSSVRQTIHNMFMRETQMPYFMGLTEVLPSRDPAGITAKLANRLILEAIMAVSWW